MAIVIGFSDVITSELDVYIEEIVDKITGELSTNSIK